VRRPSRTCLIASVLILLALGLRIAVVQGTSYRPVNDAGSYLTLGSEVARTGDYSTNRAPAYGAGGTRGPSAYFPPGFPYFLAGVDILDGHRVRRDGAIHPARLSQAVLGTVTVGLAGIVALEVFGAAVGLATLALAAIYPVLIELSTVLVAENLMTALVLAAVYAMLRAGRSERPYAWVAGAGVLAGLATLTHVNVLVLLPALIAGAIWAKPTITAPALMLALWAVVLVPWTLRNEHEMHRFLPVTDETGITLVGTYNHASAANPKVPYKWRLYYGIPGERRLVRQSKQLTELELSDRLEDQAFDYLGAHPFAPFAVLFYNSLRLLELEGSFAWQASASAIHVPDTTARIGVISFWVLCVLAVGGIFIPRARRAPLWLWSIPVLLWLSAALVNAETPRFREPVDPFLILLAACCLVSLAQHAAVRLREPARLRRLRGAPIA
jgi:4-amino-4-deoxy-L-arabinose transferase-like glycosyltransferase